MKFWKSRELLIMAYLVADTLTYRHLVKVDPSHALETGTMLKNLGISFVWPLYWLMSAFT
jgi:hypothetical protein